MTKVTVRIDDSELSDELESAESKSELIRQALRQYRRERERRTPSSGLTERERTALQWIRANIRESMGLSLVCSQVAQELGVNQEYVRSQIIPTLDSKDLIATNQSMHSVRVSVPDSDPDPPAGEGETEP